MLVTKSQLLLDPCSPAGCWLCLRSPGTSRFVRVQALYIVLFKLIKGVRQVVATLRLTTAVLEDASE